ncbi:hypothetical protein Scep_026003 [Stephania cephalantha]|uniref:Fe2OG dioxygenase domain-containing protein n=1 Tax=Stephania cephalantha TaxID=152367 RepID=A0AAP0EJR1_9MAGN
MTMVGSLPVPNVQDLAQKELKEVPDRYVQREAESEHIEFEMSDQIPVIDLQKLLHKDPCISSNEMAKFHRACKDWGFFQLINHSVDEELMRKMVCNAEEFFNLPLEEKKAYAQVPESFQGYGQAFVVSEEQKLEWSDMLSLRTLPVYQRNMRFWPKKPPSFSETLDKYAFAMEKVTFCLLSLIAKNLGVEPKKLTSIFDDGVQGTRMNYYPPCPQPEKVLGLSPHSDASIITLLIQNNDLPGLQIKINGNGWVPIKPISGAFIVNIGDAIEIMSNGLYKSIEHRAVIHPDRARISIAGFQDPRSGVLIGPLQGLLERENVATKYKAVNFDEYLRQYFSAKLDGKTMLDLIKFEKNEDQERA